MQEWAFGLTDSVPIDYLAFAWMASFPSYKLSDVWEMSTDDLFTALEFITVEGSTKKPLRYT